MRYPPIFPMHVGDYLGDTGHLTTIEHGAYHLLLYHYWRNGPLLAENKHLASIAKMRLDHWMRIRETIQRFFVAKDGLWWHIRVQKEFAYASEKRRRREEAGRLGGIEKARKISSNAIPMLQHSPSKNLASSSSSFVESSIEESLSLPIESIQNSLLVDRSAMRPAYSEEFEEFWKTYPKREGPNPKAPAEKKFTAARQSGVPLEAILSGTRRFSADCKRRQQIGTRFIPRADTWLNQKCWRDYGLDELVPLANGHVRKEPLTPEQMEIAKKMAEEGAKFFDEFGNLKPY